MRDRLRLDDSHPPTVDRIAVVNAHYALPKISLDAYAADRIEAELDPFVKDLAEQAYGDYLDRYS